MIESMAAVAFLSDRRAWPRFRMWPVSTAVEAALGLIGWLGMGIAMSRLTTRLFKAFTMSGIAVRLLEAYSLAGLTTATQTAPTLTLCFLVLLVLELWCYPINGGDGGVAGRYESHLSRGRLLGSAKLDKLSERYIVARKRFLPEFLTPAAGDDLQNET
jgi:hypothetical protein